MSERAPARPGIPAEPNVAPEAHDVLAAEEFAMPAPEAAWRDRPVVLPPEPNPSDAPHDVLAAEEFAMPAPPPHVAFEVAPAQPAPARRPLVLIAVAAAALGALVARLARRR